MDDVLLSQRERRLEKLGAAAYDPAGRCLYVFEPLADGDKSVVHVWQVDVAAALRP